MTHAPDNRQLCNPANTTVPEPCPDQFQPVGQAGDALAGIRCALRAWHPDSHVARVEGMAGDGVLRW